MSFNKNGLQAFAIENAPYTIFDSGTSHIIVPPLMY